MSGFLGGGIGPMALKRRAAASGNGLLNNLIAYWPLNEVGGANNALDLHSNALHLTQVASPGSNTGKVYAGARTFNGSTQYFSRASEALLQTGDVDFTIAAWVNVASLAALGVILSKDGSAKREFHLAYRNGTGALLFRIYDGTGALVDITGGNLSLNTWHLVTIWRSAATNTAHVAIDDNAPASGALSGTPGANTAAFYLANYGFNSNLLNGRIGPVAMWKSVAGGGGVLSEAQRTSLYNGGAGLAYADFTA